MIPTRAKALCCAAAVGAVTGPATASAASTSIVTMSGSTSVAPLAAQLARNYVSYVSTRSHGTRHVKFKLAQGGSDVGIADAAAGRVTIGNSSRDPKPTDPGGLTFTRIARDAICLITNTSNRLGNLSQAQVQAIYGGTLRNWGQVPGATVGGAIDLVQRTAASGTRDAFQKIFMGSTLVSTTAAAKASNGLVQQSVQSDPNAIGYVSLAFAGGTNPISYQGNVCNLRDAKTGVYGGVRSFYMVTRGAPTGPAAGFISWILSNAKANSIITRSYVPLH